MNVPEFLGGGKHLYHWLQPSITGEQYLAGAAHAGDYAAAGAHGEAEHAGHGLEWALAIASSLWAILALAAGVYVYGPGIRIAQSAAALGGGALRRVLENKWYVDEIYEAVVINPIHRLSDTVLWRTIDAVIIDGVLVNGVSRILAVIGQLVRLVQNGLLRWYAYSFAAGVLVLLIYVARRLNG
jgi:NADH-quinone oxidoreductase subunit L